MICGHAVCFVALTCSAVRNGGQFGNTQARNFAAVYEEKGKVKYLRPLVCSPGVAERKDFFLQLVYII